MGSDAGGVSWEKKSSTNEESKKNDPWGNIPVLPSDNTWDKGKVDGGDGAWEKHTGSCKEQEMHVDQDGPTRQHPYQVTWEKKDSDDGPDSWENPNSWNVPSLNVDQDSRGNPWVKKKSDSESQWEQLSTYKRKKRNSDHDSWDNIAMAPSGKLMRELEGQLPSLMQDPVGPRQIRWRLMSIHKFRKNWTRGIQGNKMKVHGIKLMHHRIPGVSVTVQLRIARRRAPGTK